MSDGRTTAELPVLEGTTAVIDGWLQVLSEGDTDAAQRAREELIRHGKRRMEDLCRRMFFHSLSARPVDVDDVYQESALRLWKSLCAVQPATARDFFGLAARQIRRVLIDFARKYATSPPPIAAEGQQPAFDPAALEIWSRFHEEVDVLPEDLKDVVELLWYHELTQEDAAHLLGVDKSTVKRRWRRARTQLVLRLRGCV